MKYLQLMACLLLVFSACAETAIPVKSVEAHQRYPWNGLVDIVVTFECVECDVAMTVCSFSATNSATRAAIPVDHVTRNGADVGSGGIWTRKYIWDAAADVGAVKIDDVALTVNANVPGVQLWENGPYWAECNVGASKPEEYGYYFWWGDTVGYKRNSSNSGWVSVKNGASYSFRSCPTCGESNSRLQSAGYIDSTGNLVASHDAATEHLGAPWRMPTDAEFAALISNCNTAWMSHNGVNGLFVTGRGSYSPKRIFLPAAGFGLDDRMDGSGDYWSSTPASDVSAGIFDAWFLKFNWGGGCVTSMSPSYDHGRDRGRQVRPVRSFNK